MKFDHMLLPVSNPQVSRDCYVKNLAFKVEFENATTVAIQDDGGFTIFLQNTKSPPAGERCALTIQVNDADEKYRELEIEGIVFLEAPKRYFWGYGAECLILTVI